MSSIPRTPARPRAILARIVVFAGVVTSLHPTFAPAATRPLPAIAPPALPTVEPPAAPPRSFLQARLTLPIEPYRRELERLVPRELRAAGVEERVTVEELLRDDEQDAARAGVRWRGPIRRAAFTGESRGDTLHTRTTVHYRLDIAGEGFAPTACGSATDSLAGRVELTTRFAWGDGWRLESRTRPQAVVYPTRCKPRPPAINFTRLVDERIKGRLLAPLVPALDSLVAATDLAPRVRELHAGLARPVSLGGGAWLHWRPGEIRAERPRLEGDALVVDLAIEAAPTILPGDQAGAVAFPAAPVQRLFDSETSVPIDCWVEFSEIASRLVGLAAAAPGSRDSIRVVAAAPRGAGERLVLELELDGALAGRAYLVGDARCVVPGFALEFPDLAWSEETRRAIGDALPAAQVDALGVALDELRDQARSRLRFDLSRCVVQWNQAIAGALAAGEPRWTTGFNRREVGAIFCTDRAIGVRVIEQGRVRRTD